MSYEDVIFLIRHQIGTSESKVIFVQYLNWTLIFCESYSEDFGFSLARMSDRWEDWTWFNCFQSNYHHRSQFSWLSAGEDETKAVTRARDSIWRPVRGGGWLYQRDNEEGMPVRGSEWEKEGKEGRRAGNSDVMASSVMDQPFERVRSIIETPLQYPPKLRAQAIANLDSEWGVKEGGQGGEGVEVACEGEGEEPQQQQFCQKGKNDRGRAPYQNLLKDNSVKYDKVERRARRQVREVKKFSRCGTSRLHQGSPAQFDNVRTLKTYKIPHLPASSQPSPTPPASPSPSIPPPSSTPRRVLIGAPPAPWCAVPRSPPTPPAPTPSHQPSGIPPPLDNLFFSWMMNHMQLLLSRLAKFFFSPSDY